MRTPILRSGSFAALGLSLVLAACGGSAPSSEATATSAQSAASQAATASEAAAASQAAAASEAAGADATLCDLVPIDQVATALGAATGGGVADDSVLTGGTSCRFTADADHVLDVSTSAQTRDEWFAAIETVGLTDEEVSGIGEEAYRAAGTALGGPGARFSTWADGRQVSITIYSDADQEITFAAAEAIAEAVLAAGD